MSKLSKSVKPTAEISHFSNFSRRQPAANLDFKILTICEGLRCITVPNFIKIGKAVAEISQFFHFQDGG